MRQKISKTDQKLIELLRQKQAKLDIHYLTTDSGVYRVFQVPFYLLTAVAALINLIYLFGMSGRLRANLSNVDSLSELQAKQAADVKNSLYTVAIMGVLLLAAAFFLRFKRPILQLIFTLLPSGVLLWTYASQLSESLQSGSYQSFVFKHLLPLGLLMLCSLVTGIIHLRQRLLDRKGCEEISEQIYRKYSVLADHITPEQWEEILAGYQPDQSRSKKRSVKQRAKKQREAEHTEV